MKKTILIAVMYLFNENKIKTYLDRYQSIDHMIVKHQTKVWHKLKGIGEK